MKEHFLKDLSLKSFELYVVKPRRLKYWVKDTQNKEEFQNAFIIPYLNYSSASN